MDLKELAKMAQRFVLDESTYKDFKFIAEQATDEEREAFKFFIDQLSPRRV